MQITQGIAAMPSVIETAKEASYTALGLNVLFIEEMTERFTTPREQMEEQLDIARDHATKARADWQKQADQFNTNVKERLPFDMDEVSTQIQDRVQPVVRRSWEAAEPVVARIVDMTPAPFDTYVKDGADKLAELLAEEAAPAKPAARKPAARKPAAKKTVAKKPAAKKAASKA